MDLDLQHQTQLFLGLYEVELRAWLKRLSSSANTAIDVGAGEGSYSLYFLLKTSVERVLAFEPSDASRDQLVHNLNLNNLKGTKRLELSPMSVSSRNAADSCALDSVIEGKSGPFIIKVDVEGAEYEVLKGARSLLEGNSSWIVEIHSTAAAADCRALFRDFGMKTVSIHSAWWRLVIPEYRPLSVNHWLVARPNGA